MKTKDIARQYGFDLAQFEDYCIKHPATGFTNGAFSSTIPDVNVKSAVEAFQFYLEHKDEEEREKEAIKKRQAEAEANFKEAEARRMAEKQRKEQEKKAALASMLITSGFNFDGYTIKQYSGYISGDDATQIPRSGVFGGNNGKNLTDALVRIRIQAIKELKEAAYDLGCNAVIGVDFDYITLEPETANISGGTLYEPYIICVTANGNAVVIEKNTNESN